MKDNNESEQFVPEPAPDVQELKDNAIRLQSIGLNPISLRPITPEGKSPFLKPGELKDSPNGFFHRKSTIEDVSEWVRRDRRSRERGSDWYWEGFAIVTGETSDIFVLDSDGPKGEELIRNCGDPHTWKSATGRGYQRFYRLPEGMKIDTMIKAIHAELDIMGNRGYVAVFPSLHYLGKRYRWVNSPFDTPLADAPEWLLGAIKLALGEGIKREEYSSIPEEFISHIRKTGTTRQHSGGPGEGKIKNIPPGEKIPYGQRNTVLFRRACRYRYLGHEEVEIYEKLRVDNRTSCEADPEGELLSDEEIKRITQSACRYPKGSAPPPEVLAAIEVVDSYYLENPPKGMAEHTDRDITEAILQEALLHCKPVPAGIELSISYGDLADKAGVGIVPSGKR